MQLTAIRKKRRSIQKSSTQNCSIQESSTLELTSVTSDNHQFKRYRNINKSLTIASLALFSTPAMATEIDETVQDIGDADKTSISLLRYSEREKT